MYVSFRSNFHLSVSSFAPVINFWHCKETLWTACILSGVGQERTKRNRGGTATGFRARGAWASGQVCPTNALNLRELRGRRTNKRCRGDSWSNSRWLDIVRGKELSRAVNTESACRSSGESAVGQQRLLGTRERERERGEEDAATATRRCWWIL